MCFEEQLNLDYLESHERNPEHTLTGHPLHIKMWPQLSYTLKQRGDVIRVLMRDYYDITGTSAKLNLLAAPCA